MALEKPAKTKFILLYLVADKPQQEHIGANLEKEIQ